MTTTLERAFCVLGMVIGATVFGYIVGNVSVMMEGFDLQSALRIQKMDRVKVSLRPILESGCRWCRFSDRCRAIPIAFPSTTRY